VNGNNPHPDTRELADLLVAPDCGSLESGKIIPFAVCHQPPEGSDQEKRSGLDWHEDLVRALNCLLQIDQKRARPSLLFDTRKRWERKNAPPVRANGGTERRV